MNNTADNNPGINKRNISIDKNTTLRNCNFNIDPNITLEIFNTQMTDTTIELKLPDKYNKLFHCRIENCSINNSNICLSDTRNLYFSDSVIINTQISSDLSAEISITNSSIEDCVLERLKRIQIYGKVLLRDCYVSEDVFIESAENFWFNSCVLNDTVIRAPIESRNPCNEVYLNPPIVNFHSLNLREKKFNTEDSVARLLLFSNILI